MRVMNMRSINIDERTFEATAKVVFEINDRVKECRDDWLDLMYFMESMAYSYMKDSNFFSTSGFCLTAFDTCGNERTVVATVMTYTVEKYIEKVNATKKAARKILKS
jgi:hypothetical protein